MRTQRVTGLVSRVLEVVAWVPDHAEPAHHGPGPLVVDAGERDDLFQTEGAEAMVGAHRAASVA